MSGYSPFDDTKKTPGKDGAFSEYRTDTNSFILMNSNTNLLNDNDNSHDVSYSDFTNDSRTEMSLNDLSTSEAHHNVPLEHDIVPLHASHSMPIEHVKHPPKIWRPLAVIIADLLFGMLFITASLAGTIFGFRPVQILDFHHDIFLIFGIYGIFIFGFSIVAAISYRGQVKSLLLIFVMWKHVSLIIDVIVTLIIVSLIYSGVMGTFDYCAHSHRCIVTTSLIVTTIGAVYFIVDLLGIYFMKLYLRERYGGHLLDSRRNSADGITRHSFLDDIESSFIEMPELGYGNVQSPQRVAVLRFNRKPEAGIDFLVSNGIIGSSPTEIAKYLTSTENLNLTKIGEYISENKPTNLEVLQELTNQFEFKNMEFDEAIRLFLSKFRLPGEAQKIDRIMESFAKRYCFCNSQGIFPHPDTAYILAFAVIMLNTDAHNPAIKKKMSKKEFIQNNKGIANGKDLPIEYLESLYDKIVNNEIKLNSEELFVKVVKKGWLKKMGRNSRWQRHWFVVANNCLYYFATPGDKDPKVIIPLEGLSIRENTDYKDKYCFELFDPNNHKIKSCKLGPQGPVEGQHDRFLLQVERLDDYESWLASVKKNIVLSPVTQLLNMKKQKLLQKQKL